MKCQKCSKDFKTKTSLRAHSSWCQKPKSALGKRYGHIWNKGLTKQTDSRVAQIGATLSTVMIGKGHKQSIETREKISKSFIKAHSEGRMVGWAHINSDPNRMSSSEKVFKKWLDNAKISYQIHLNVGKYFLDFAITDLKIDIEIDGCQHFRSNDAIEHDRKRDSWLMAQGWKIHRIKWADFCKNKQSEFEKLLTLISPLPTKQSKE